MPVTTPVKKETTIETDLKKCLVKYSGLKAEKKLIQKNLEIINEKIAPVEKLAFETMEGLSLTSLTMGDQTFFRTTKKFFSMKDKVKAMKWIKTKFPELLSVNATTLTSFLKGQLEEKKKIPKDLFNDYSKDTVGIRKKA